MKSIGLFLLASVALFGQRAGVAPPRGSNGNAYARPNSYGSVSGFGNVVFPGTGHAPVISGSITDTGFGARLGATVSGHPPYTGAPAGGGRGRGGRSVVYVPYAVGVPGYGYYGDQGAPPQIVMYPQQQTAPQVVINQNFIPEPAAQPIVREYTQDAAGGIRVYAPSVPAAAAPEDENPTYLIAFKDHTIYAARAYWVEGETLHYVTGQNTHNQVSLDLVDRDLSSRLNSERNVDFRLPPPRR